ncbi:hypothetical protein BCAR13_60281 [Paraburkholderia caribensis]|nr:hypothetical protein BCAR13_60281 [Paraburkholderia caribensis]
MRVALEIRFSALRHNSRDRRDGTRQFHYCTAPVVYNPALFSPFPCPSRRHVRVSRPVPDRPHAEG